MIVCTVSLQLKLTKKGGPESMEFGCTQRIMVHSAMFHIFCINRLSALFGHLSGRAFQTYMLVLY